MKIVGAYCVGARDITVVDAPREKQRVRIGKGNRKCMPHTKRRKGEMRDGGTFLRARRNDRSILIPTMRRNEASEEIHSPIALPPFPFPFPFPHFLSSSSLPRSRLPSPRKCARGNRRTRFQRHSTSSPCFPPFLLSHPPLSPFYIRSARICREIFTVFQ